MKLLHVSNARRYINKRFKKVVVWLLTSAVPSRCDHARCLRHVDKRYTMNCICRIRYYFTGCSGTMRRTQRHHVEMARGTTKGFPYSTPWRWYTTNHSSALQSTVNIPSQGTSNSRELHACGSALILLGCSGWLCLALACLLMASLE